MIWHQRVNRPLFILVSLHCCTKYPKCHFWSFRVQKYFTGSMCSLSVYLTALRLQDRSTWKVCCLCSIDFSCFCLFIFRFHSTCFAVVVFHKINFIPDWWNGSLSPVPQANVIHAVISEVNDYQRDLLPPVTAQPSHHASVVASILEQHTAELTAAQERENEWNSQGLLSRLTPQVHSQRSSESRAPEQVWLWTPQLDTKPL